MRCSCMHLMARHNVNGCRYCDCLHQPLQVAEALARVADDMAARGYKVIADDLRALRENVLA